MTKPKYHCAVEEVNGKVFCFIHGANRWEDFEPLVQTLRDLNEVHPFKRVEGPASQHLEFEYEGHVFSLVCDDAYGHDILMKDPQDKALMEALAVRCQRLFDTPAQERATHE